MNLLHMKQALEVAKSGSINKAAEVLLVAAPNISRSIKELESDLGITIFERTQNGMNLTPDGEEFLDFAKSILARLTELRITIRRVISESKPFLFLRQEQVMFVRHLQNSLNLFPRMLLKSSIKKPIPNARLTI